MQKTISVVLLLALIIGLSACGAPKEFTSAQMDSIKRVADTQAQRVLSRYQAEADVSYDFGTYKDKPSVIIDIVFPADLDISIARRAHMVYALENEIEEAVVTKVKIDPSSSSVAVAIRSESLGSMRAYTISDKVTYIEHGEDVIDGLTWDQIDSDEAFQ